MVEFLWDRVLIIDESVRVREFVSLGLLWMGWMVGELIMSVVFVGLIGCFEVS